MKMRVSCTLALGFVLGCGQSNSSAPAPAASTSASSVPEKLTVQRKTTPAALRIADEKDCLAGKKDACRRMADRYRGYGHTAGCGLDREGPETVHGRTTKGMAVRIRRVVDDGPDDVKQFLTWIGKACDLDDSEACTIEGFARSSRKHEFHLDLQDGALRSNIQSSALAGFVESVNLIKYNKFLEKRQSCWTSSVADCTELSKFLMTQGKDELPPKFTPEWLTTLQAVGEKTLDFETLYMMLDKLGHAAEAIAPLKAHAAKTLVKACVEGSCVCSDAAKSLPADDPRVVDLARWGCENGEANGCYLLGKLYEEGRGVEKDEVFARSLYEQACPSRRASSVSRSGDISPAACVKLAEAAEGGAIPPKDRARALYYVQALCSSPGYERDHSYCVKLAKYWTSGVMPNSCPESSSDACKANIPVVSSLLNGPTDDPLNGKECQRPSVKALCEPALAELEALKKPPEKKK
jgi:Sel1 repeat